MGDIRVKLYEIWTSGSGGDVVLRKSLRTDAQRTDARWKRPITIVRLEPLAQVS